MIANNNHSLCRNYGFKYRNSKVYLSKKPDERVMIFVHGFNGHPVKTWGKFPGELTTLPEFSGIDLIFYNYDSKTTQANNSAAHLEEFLNIISNHPNQIIKEMGDVPGTKQEIRNENFRYKKIYLVAHSLGAIVSRLAIIRANKLNVEWPKLTELVFFAPAHMGARADAIKSIVELFFPATLGLLRAYVFFKIVTIDDVDLTRSHCILHSLKRDTENLQTDASHKFTIARKVLFAEKDNIVSNADFLKDPPGILIDLADHISVCKPSGINYDPIKQLKKVVTT